MKKISNIMTALLAAFSLVLSACSDNDDPNPLVESNGTLSISTTEMTFPASGGESSFTVNGGTAFVSSEASWLTVERESGDSKSSTFIVTCAENTADTARVGTILANLDGAFTRVTVTQQAKVVEPDVTYTFRTAKQLAKEMYPGWNLGNTLEATMDGQTATVDWETAWQSTKTTQEIIDYVKAQGFKTVRIPCSWDAHASNGTIDAAWMSRVKEVVDYCINDGLYVILNDHYDGGWIEVYGFTSSSETFTKVDDATVTSKASLLKTYWTQIANAFQNYDEHLLFAGMNEPYHDFSSSSDDAIVAILEQYNQAFIDAVRATGGNNAKRTLIVQGPATNIDLACQDNFTMPTDNNGQTGYMMAEVHYYDPWQFCGLEEDASWGKANYYWGSANHVDASEHNASSSYEESYVASQMAKLKSKFYDKGYPVVIGEYGANWRSLSASGGESQDKHDASVKLWFKTVTSEAVNNGCVPVVWDINVASQQGTKGVMTIINRANLSVFCTPALESLTEGVAAAAMP